MQTPPRPSRKFLSKRMSCCLFGLLAGVGMVGFGLRTLFSPLPWGAYPVLSTSRWVALLPEPQKRPAYSWLFNGDLAYLEANADGKFQVCYQKMDLHGPVGAVRHGPELPSDVQYGACWPSTNEQWIVYNTRPSRPNNFQITLITADGKTTKTYSGMFMGWLPDSQRFLTLVPSTPIYTLTIRDLNTLHLETRQGTTLGGLTIPMETMPHGDDFLMGGWNIKSDMTIRSFSLSQAQVVETRTWHVFAPTEAYFIVFSVSPDRKHLLWTLYGKKQEPWRQWLSRFLPKQSQDPLKSTSFFLSDIEGHDMHPILNNLVNGTSNLTPTWTPDSKHLSFVYQQQLYLFPVH